MREVDLADELWGPAFEPLKDQAIFAQATVEGGTVVWPTGSDVDPLVLHGDYPPAETRPDHCVG